MTDDINKYYDVVEKLKSINENVNEDAEYNNMFTQKLVEYGARHISDLSPIRKATFFQEINEWVQQKQDKVKKAKKVEDDVKLTADADKRKKKDVKNALKEAKCYTGNYTGSDILPFEIEIRDFNDWDNYIISNNINDFKKFVNPEALRGLTKKDFNKDGELKRGIDSRDVYTDFEVELSESVKNALKESNINFVPVKTPADLKYNVELTGSHFFERSSMKFFGDTMGNYGVRHLKEKGVYELYRKHPVKHGLNKSAYFDDKTFERIYSLEESKKIDDESADTKNSSIQENINRQKEIIQTLLKEAKPEFDTYEADADAVMLVIDNDRKLYDRKLQAFKSLTNKKKRNVYDKELAPKIFLPLAQIGAKQWYDETVNWADDGKSIVKKVTKEVIDAVAKEYAKEFESAYENKEYKFMTEEDNNKKKVDESLKDTNKKGYYSGRLVIFPEFYYKGVTHKNITLEIGNITGWNGGGVPAYQIINPETKEIYSNGTSQNSFRKYLKK